MKSIAIVTRKLITGGVEKALLAMLNKFDYSKVSVDLYVENAGGDLYKDINKNVSVYTLPNAKGINLLCHPLLIINKAAARIGLKLNKGSYFHQNVLYSRMLLPVKKEYDMAIAYHAPNTVPVMYVADKMSAKKKVLWLHGDLESNGAVNEEAKQIYSKYDKVFGVSESVTDSFIRHCPQMKDRTKIFYNYVNKEDINNKANTGKSYEDSFNGTRILTIGRLNPQKGYDLAIEVCKRLKQESYNIRWYVCGEGEQRKELEESIRKNGLKKDFVLLGNQENPYAYLKDCDLYVQPSRYEGYCTTTNEARILNKPIITTDVSGAREQFENGVTGFVVGIDADSIAERIGYCIDNPDEVQRICANLEMVMREFENSDEQLQMLLE